MSLPMTHTQKAFGSLTNGIGRRSDYHLNTTRSLADVWPAMEPETGRKARHKGTFCLSDGRLFLHRNGRRMTRDIGEAMTDSEHKMRLIKNATDIARVLRIVPA